MVFKKFMEEVAAVELAGEFKNSADQEVAEGEEVVGSIADNPYLMALCTVVGGRVEALENKISKMTEDEVQRVAQEFETAKEIMWAELRFHFGAFKYGIGLRKGWAVVRTKEKQLVRRLQVLEIPIDELPGFDSLLDLPDCGDPDCIVHGRGRRGRRKPIAEA